MKKPNPKASKENEQVLEDDTYIGFNKYGPSRSQLPIQDSKIEILYSVENYSCTVVIAETGSGKTTQIPQFLVETGYALKGKCIAVTVPRRVAAISVAQRVAEEMETAVGGEVGYHIRFEDKSSESTVIKFFTDGMLVRQMMQDPLLENFSVIMVDDIHEATVYTDIILGLLKKIRKKRPDLKIIVSSATLDADRIANYFEGDKKEFKSNIVHVAGRQYPVDISYLSAPCKNYVTKAAELALDIHQRKPLGDVLVFLTGQEEIQAFIDFVDEQSDSLKTDIALRCVPLFGNMSIEAQMAVFEPTPANTRKVIVSTNIAESSVTIDNIAYVIDSCFVKIKYFDYFKVTPESKSSANQRAGRAGRVKGKKARACSQKAHLISLKAGECYRLCTKKDFDGLFDSSPPEIIRTNLTSAILQMKCLGIGNLMKFDFITKPTEESMVRALEILFSLGALDRAGNLTQDIGWKLTELPIEPRLGVALINSAKEEYLCSEEMLKLVAMLSAPSIFYTGRSSGLVIKSKKKLGAKEGDHITLINIFLRYEHIRNVADQKKFCSEQGISFKSIENARGIHTQLKRFMNQHKLKIKTSDDDAEIILKCLATGFFDHVAQKQPDGSYQGLRSRDALHLHPQSVLHAVYPNWVIYHEVVTTGKNYMREASSIDPKWLLQIAPHFYEDTTAKQIEAKRNRELSEINKFEAEKEKRVKTETKAGPISTTAASKPKKSNFVISDMEYGDDN